METALKPLGMFTALLLVVSALFAMPMVHLQGSQAATTIAFAHDASLPCDAGHTNVEEHCGMVTGCMYCGAMPRTAGSLPKGAGILLPTPVLSLHGASVSPDFRPPKQFV